MYNKNARYEDYSQIIERALITTIKHEYYFIPIIYNIIGRGEDAFMWEIVLAMSTPPHLVVIIITINHDAKCQMSNIVTRTSINCICYTIYRFQKKDKRESR